MIAYVGFQGKHFLLLLMNENRKVDWSINFRVCVNVYESFQFNKNSKCMLNLL